MNDLDLVRVRLEKLWVTYCFSSSFFSKTPTALRQNFTATTHTPHRNTSCNPPCRIVLIQQPDVKHRVAAASRTTAALPPTTTTKTATMMTGVIPPLVDLVLSRANAGRGRFFLDDLAPFASRAETAACLPLLDDLALFAARAEDKRVLYLPFLFLLFLFDVQRGKLAGVRKNEISLVESSSSSSTTVQ